METLAYSKMSWKFLLVNLLLVVPNIWNLTSGNFMDRQQEEPDVNGPYQEQYDIMELLNEQVDMDKQQGSVDKKDQQQKAHDVGSSNNGINLELQDPIIDKTKSANIQSGNNKPPAELHYKGRGQEISYAVPGQASALQQQQNGDYNRDSRIIKPDDKQFIIIVAVAVSTSFVGLMLAGVCYYKFRKSAKAASDVEYPVYGVTGPVKERIPSPGDRKLAQSAQMYHYQHQKQQMIAMEKANGDMKHDASDDESEEDNVEGDYTVYECPGLAPTGEMEVRNPLFRGDDTPVTPGEDITGHPLGQDPERGN